MIRQYALDQVGGPYVYGATAKPCTPAYRRARIAQYPDYANAIKRNCPVLTGKQSSCDGCKYQGMLAHDCAQLTRFAANAGGLYLPSGASSQWRKGDWEVTGPIAEMPQDKVCIVYKRTSGGNPMGHTGVYLGNGYTVDSRSHDKGTVRSALSAYAWTDYARLKGMDEEMPEAAEADTRATLRRGKKGEAVLELQKMLLSMGYSLPRYGADGSYGAETITAVKAFQLDNGLKADGITGPGTWAALLAWEPSTEAPEDAPDGEEPPAWDALTLAEKVEDLHARLTALEGGVTSG
jgi:hypothetical protein